MRPYESTYVKYTEGDCWALALVLHERLKWPIYVVSDNGHENWDHAVVLAPNGMYFDIGGYRTEKELREEFPSGDVFTMVEVDVGFFDEHRETTGLWYAENWEEVEYDATELMKEYLDATE